METYFKLYTRFLNWEWYKDVPTKTLFLHCLLKANYKEKTCFGQKIERGQFITSIAHLASETGLSIQQTRTALEKLKRTKNLTSESTNQNTVITILNWDKYHTEQQTSNTRATTTNNSTIGTISSKPSYSNNTHTNKCVCVNLSEEEKKVLVRYAKKSNARNIEAYVNSLIRNGGYKEILETEKARRQKFEQEEQERRRQIEVINTQQTITPEEESKIIEIQKQLRERLQRR